MTPRRFTELAELAGNRYSLLVDSWQTIYARAVVAQDFGSARWLRQAEDNARGVADRHLASEREIINSITAHLVAQSRADASTPLGATLVGVGAENALPEHAMGLAEYLAGEIAAQIERDVAFLRRALMRVAAEVSWIADATGLPLRAAMIQWRVDYGDELRFYFRDRAGRKWPSQKFVRAAWRQHLLDTWNETMLGALSGLGQVEAEVRHADTNAKHHGLRISIIPGRGLPTYAEIRDEIFHTGADALLHPVREIR